MEMTPAVAAPQDGGAAGAAAKAAETGLLLQKSPLDKPLGELTEDDIAQVTREDCRRFLKDKGMRRPSWNKSQAIQQVISLKALLEGKPGDGGGGGPPSARQKPTDPVPPPQPQVSPLPPPHQPQQTTARLPQQQQQPPPPALLQQYPSNSEETTPYRRRDLAAPPPFATCGAPFAHPPSPPVTEPHPPEVAGISPRVASEAPSQAVAASGQMTIFYGGRVNVYNEVPTEKARAIMQLAASRECYGGPLSPPVDLNRQTVIAQHQCSAPLPVSLPPPPPLHPPAAASAVGCMKFLPHYSREGAEWRSPKDFDHEGPICRKASLQRYLEKRKDRKTIKYKKTMDGSPTSFMEMYLSQKLICQRSIGKQGHDPSSLGHPNPPPTPTRSSSIDNQTKSVRFYIDLNDDDVQEI